MSDQNHEGKFCPECGIAAADRQQFCRQCGFEFPPEDVGEERNLRAAIAAESGPSCVAGIVKVIGFFMILGIFLGIAADRRSSRLFRDQAREKACYANMRVLLGAIEMYNMDNKIPLKSFREDTEQRLVNDKYLRSSLSKPEPTCRYSSTGDITTVGKITCDVHGTVE
ncbi:MAG TPA: hypothetical protein PLU72_16125 [Candidatus Ozemobacteraceae bacterium]|nr:hypothetical protein [Candidatus Ozemobacteraceae bacterium]HQG28236.1 hypothetical protein [Candidatus Ozemobacteraceae bacterium]